MSKFKGIGVQMYYYHITVHTKFGNGKFVTSLHWEGYTLDEFQRWKWYFKYRSALLQVKYPKYFVNDTWGGIPATGKTKQKLEEEILKKDITTCKRMITKISNAINEYEIEERKSLIPNWENPKYLRTKDKLNEYRTKLSKLI